MQPRLVRPRESALPSTLPRDSKQQFRQHFQRSLRACLRRHFSFEEAFGLIFAETLQEVPLTAAEEAELYEELLNRAREGQELFPRYSTALFTGCGVPNRESH